MTLPYISGVGCGPTFPGWIEFFLGGDTYPGKVIVSGVVVIIILAPNISPRKYCG